MDMGTILLLALAGGALLLLAVVTRFSGQGSLNNIKSKTVGDGQHGTARWATKKEIRQTYVLPERAARKVAYASKQELEAAILGCHSLQQRPQEAPATPATTPKNRTQGREQEEWEKLGPSTSIKGLKKPGGEAT